MMGRSSEAPAWDTGKSTAGGTPQAEPASGQKRPTSVISCSSCGYYPLRSEPSAQAPCINCGFTGVNTSKSTITGAGLSTAEATSSTISSSAKTVRIDAIRLGEDDKKPGKVVLTDTVSGKELMFEGSVIELNRADLDPSNTTISSTHHLTLHLGSEGIGVEDKSSNGATFVQAIGKVSVVSGSLLIVGNRVYKIDLK
jgi:hypothetical protein